MRKHPAEEKAVKLLKDGLSDQDVAEAVGTTANHIWAIRVVTGFKPVTEKQAEIAKAIVARKRRGVASDQVAEATKTARPVAKSGLRIAASAGGPRKPRTAKRTAKGGKPSKK